MSGSQSGALILQRFATAAAAGLALRQRLKGLDPTARAKANAAAITARRDTLRRAFDLLRHMEASNQRRRASLKGYLPMRDDGLTDEAWARLKPQREYRIRPWRPTDGEPATFHFPCFTCVHLPTGASGLGIPVDALRVAGVTIWPYDADEFCEALFWACSVTDGFRHEIRADS